MNEPIMLKYTDYQAIESGNDPTKRKEITDKITDQRQVYIVIKDGTQYKVAITDKGLGLVPV
jgi:hypothetical protein